MKNRRDPGLELGKQISSWFTSRACQSSRTKRAEKQALLDDYEELPGYTTAGHSPEVCTAPEPEPQGTLALGEMVPGTDQAGIAVTKSVFTKPVVVIIVSYGLLAL
jgi:hypothetical protein